MLASVSSDDVSAGAENPSKGRQKYPNSLEQAHQNQWRRAKKRRRMLTGIRIYIYPSMLAFKFALALPSKRDWLNRAGHRHPARDTCKSGGLRRCVFASEFKIDIYIYMYIKHAGDMP
jgi:hypothetical protein